MTRPFARPWRLRALLPRLMAGVQTNVWTGVWTGVWALGWVLALLALPCGGAQAADATKNTLVVMRSADSSSLDPALAYDSESTVVVAQIYEGLVRQKDGKPQLEPALAQSWSVSPDRLTWIFTLRKGVLFHDGSPLNAQAAALSIMRQVDPNNPYHAKRMHTSRLLFENIAGAEALDEYTLRVRLLRPAASLLLALAAAQASIVSPQALARWGAEFPNHPTGTGPFKFVEWTKGEAITLARNPAYWGPAAQVERVVFRPVPDAGTRFLEFQAGRADALCNITPSDLTLLDKIPGAKVLRAPGLNIAYLGINTQHGHLRRVAVRQAVALALDRVLLTKLVYGFAAEPALTPLPPAAMEGAMLPSPATLRGDVPRAKQLLAKEGLAGGFDALLLVMDTPRAYLPEPRRMAAAIKQSLAAVGIRVRIQTVAWANYLPQIARGEHDFCISGWQYSNPNPHEFFRQKLSWDDLSKGVGSNVSLWRNKRFEELVTLAESSPTAEARLRLNQQILQLVAQEAPLVPLAHMKDIIALRPGIRGLILQPSGAELRLSTARKD
jgi:peptide/nickel transport system substrate-binding protein